MTLIELLVTLLLVSVLASVALPYGEIAVKRSKELELRRNLRTIRTAIDRFHADWKQGLIEPTSGSVSEQGYPKTLKTLVEGVSLTDGQRKRYLRRVPRNPFADQHKPHLEQWLLLSYRDDRDTKIWGGQDVYDVRVRSEAQALDGSLYAQW